MGKNKRKGLIALFTVLCIVFITGACTFASDNGNRNEVSQKDYNNDSSSIENNLVTENTKQFYMAVSRYGIDGYPSFAELFSSEEALYRLKMMNEELNNAFDFWEFGNQSVYHIGQYSGDEIFSSAYEKDGGASINREAMLADGTKNVVTDLKAIQLGKKCSDMFSDNIVQGNSFGESDFEIDDNNEIIKVILGNDYLQYYQIGDIIAFEYLQENVKLEVIGFYKPNTTLKWDSMKFNLDRYIIMPKYNINYEPTNEINDAYQKRYYMQKNDGYICLPDTTEENIREEYLSKLNEIAGKYDLNFTITQSKYVVDFDSSNEM